RCAIAVLLVFLLCCGHPRDLHSFPTRRSSDLGFGWDIDSPFSSNRGDFLPVGSYGHTGFTGTSMWIDPTTQSYIILLTNAVHPRDRKSTRLNSSHDQISYAVFCFKKKKDNFPP